MNWNQWREKARKQLIDGVSPAEAVWNDSPQFLFSVLERKPLEKPVIPKEFLEIGPLIAAAREPDRWDLLYRLVYRLNHETSHLLNIITDSDVKKAMDLVKSVRKDIHKMHAFVRFKKIEIDGQEGYIAWHKTEHLIMELGTPFFVRRFGDKPWSIFSPDASAHWNLKELTFAEGMPEHEFNHQDEFDEVWKTYYKSIFNPARLNIKMMKQEMSPKYWSSMPETALIHELIREAPERLQKMAQAPKVRADVPANLSLNGIKDLAKKCKICPWAEYATQTVFGEGNPKAKLMIVGEQPGNEEDLIGHAFIGPAGKILSEALIELGIPRDSVYITNAVKHFKWSPSEDGKARIHKKPSGSDMHACKPWLEAEIAAIKPKVIIALGATAATSILGKLVKINEVRDKVITNNSLAESIVISWHPSAILRAYDQKDANEKLAQLKIDLAKAFMLTAMPNPTAYY
ncbi:UdgX family uracil-DNA binding protein [Bdellovibrio sp. SKB1291214]|uniref:UdgX family uracil-DNA binding protein n=1 Tax=Bdellovibrio sp. SKB1291214 TaxID=1732569 RepID=UPI000B51D1A0|nr:UdgX family uracil-DNA binding protein [Bdellovibrio sp. SKB1291214]UYL07240.1 UdgX family uracil-DNA binding protein [Bdellovibrio sp. SKB1291214]